MTHEITNSDYVGIVGDTGWHGLGKKIEAGLTPLEALKGSPLDWGIVERPLAYSPNDDGLTTIAASHKVLLRSDTLEELGVVGASYQPTPNDVLAQFCEALAKETDKVVIDTLGSVRGGRRVWFNLRGDSFTVRDKDLITPYICIATGHDGTMAVKGIPTTIRSVCSNTLHAVIGRSDDGLESKRGAFSYRHSANVMDRIEEARKCLGLYVTAIAETETAIRELAETSIPRERAREFFVEQYLKDFPDPKEKGISASTSDQRNAKLGSALQSFVRRWDDEVVVAGETAWNAFNAYSGLIQHDMKARGKDDTARVENRVDSNLFGLNATRTNRAFDMAFQLAS